MAVRVLSEVQTIEDAAIARRVARMWPLLTIKG